MSYSVKMWIGEIEKGTTVPNTAFVEFKNQLDTLEISGGSMSGLDQPQPTLLTAQFLNTSFNGSTLLPANLVKQNLWVMITTPVETYRFNEFIIISASMEALDSVGDENLITITASSAMYFMSLSTTARNDFVAELESVRVANAGEGQEMQWEDLNGSIVWSDFPANRIWQQWQNIQSAQYHADTTLIDRDVIAETASPTDALSYLQNMANANDSWLYDYNGLASDNADYIENALVYYVPRQEMAAWSFKTIPGDYIVGTNLSVNSDVSSIYNDVQITNGTDSGWAADAADILYNQTSKLYLQSGLANVLDLQAMANTKIAGLGQSTATLNEITVDLDLVSTKAEMDVLLPVCQPFNYTIDDIPVAYKWQNAITDNKWQSRGGVLSLTRDHAEVTRSLIPYAVFNTGATAWSTVSPADTWATYATATSKWIDIN